MGLDDVRRRRTPPVQLAPVTAMVTAVSEAGVFVTPLGQSEEHPIGPCRGIRTRPVTVTPDPDTDALLINYLTPLPVGVHVLVMFTSTGPWIIAVDE